MRSRSPEVRRTCTARPDPALRWALYEASRRGETLGCRGDRAGDADQLAEGSFLGDKVLRRTAWRVGRSAGLGDNVQRRVRALTQLQADDFVTSDGDLARAVSALVETAAVDALRTA
jgi:hypothetical protein